VDYDYVSLLSSWLPFLLFVGFLVYARKGVFARQRKHFDSMKDFYSSDLEESRKTNAHLDRIACALEKSNSAK
jgi:hypothetical protein